MALLNCASDLPVRVRSDSGPTTGAAIVASVVEDDGVVCLVVEGEGRSLPGTDERSGEAASEPSGVDAVAAPAARMGSEASRAVCGPQRHPRQRADRDLI